MKARPILFSAPMIRALLAGTKTQTRRVVKPPRGFGPIENLRDTYPHIFPGRHDDPGSWGWPHADDGAPMSLLAWKDWLCPYGKPGDLLWVRETWSTIGDDGRVDEMPPRALQPSPVWYEADGEPTFTDLTGKTRTSIHMPRWASRLTLRITEVRVQRLRDISRGDAMAEGCPFANMAAGPDPREWYAELWGEINGPGSWDANPWVWVLTFEVIKQNVDAVMSLRAAA